MTSQALLYVIAVPILWLAIRCFRAVRSRQALLLLASWLLYASWGIGFLSLLVCSSILNYFFGRLLAARQSAGRLWVGILANLALLGTFKYVPELLPLLSRTRLAPAIAHIVLPIGISFWTFQALSFLLDTYRGDQLNPSLMEFLLYMAFWPTVLSGPICRLSSLLAQFRSTENPNLRDVARGMDRICLGLFMVAVGGLLANGIHMDQGLDHAFQISPRTFSGADVWCLAVGYGFELFLNFAGYCHLVIGAARLFGFELAENFDRPYLSTTPSEFWTRWHMSLSFWIRDYLFLPLVMLNRSKLWRNGSLVISMLIFGLWHKGTLLLVLWGTYHGLLLVLHRQWQQLKRSLGWDFSGSIPHLISWFITTASICLGWILFRSDSLPQALQMFRSLVDISSYSTVTLPHSFFFFVIVVALGYLGIVNMERLIADRSQDVRVPLEVRLALYSIAIYVGVLHAAQTQAFAYFQF
jgi:alginate O-acetyltransferase complex protein AlgI